MKFLIIIINICGIGVNTEIGYSGLLSVFGATGVLGFSVLIQPENRSRSSGAIVMMCCKSASEHLANSFNWASLIEQLLSGNSRQKSP